MHKDESPIQKFSEKLTLLHPMPSEEAFLITERMLILLIERLPRVVAEKLLNEMGRTSLMDAIQLSENGDPSLGYPDWIHCAQTNSSLCRSSCEQNSTASAEKIANLFFETIGQELSPEFIQELKLHLPAELRHRMHKNHPRVSS